ncbi:MAG: hypothetical protein HN576_00160 [Bacteriovoracaceae bacterium]|jgi:hypothetical protein|nr:hypothetical protein [Bacteriovoracaceae bacterium]
MMLKNELEQFLQTLNKELYKFTYSLLPDDLQVSQIIIDSITVLLLERRELVETLELCENDTKKENTLFSIKLFLYKRIYELIQKRSDQLSGSIEYHPDFSEYHGLDLLEKTVLYFKSKTNFEFEDLTYILSENKTTVFQALANGRNNLATRAGITSPNNLGQ